MQGITTVGLDIAKSVFQVHGVDAQGGVVIRRQLKRRYVLAFFQKLPPCLVGIEACASSVDPPTCGERITLDLFCMADTNLSELLSGSSGKTSNAAPPRWCDCRAAESAATISATFSGGQSLYSAPSFMAYVQ